MGRYFKMYPIGQSVSARAGMTYVRVFRDDRAVPGSTDESGEIQDKRPLLSTGLDVSVG